LFDELISINLVAPRLSTDFAEQKIWTFNNKSCILIIRENAHPHHSSDVLQGFGEQRSLVARLVRELST